MTASQIVEELYNTNLLTELCENIGVLPKDMDDFKQEIYLILLEYNQDKIIELYNKKQLKFFIVRIIQNQYHSKNSPFYMKYKRYSQKASELTQHIIKEQEEQYNTGWKIIRETSDID